MLEKKGGDHLHVQGEPIVGEKAFEKIQKDMTAEHYRRRQDSNARPVKRRKTVADEQGFQYMSKELPTSVVVYKQGITDEELNELYGQSNEYREDLQSKPGEYIFKAIGPNTKGWTPSDLHKRVCYYAFQYYLAEGKMRPPNIKILCEHWMAKYWGERLDVAEYISSRWI